MCLSHSELGFFPKSLNLIRIFRSSIFFVFQPPVGYMFQKKWIWQCNQLKFFLSFSKPKISKKIYENIQRRTLNMRVLTSINDRKQTVQPIFRHETAHVGWSGEVNNLSSNFCSQRFTYCSKVRYCLIEDIKFFGMRGGVANVRIRNPNCDIINDTITEFRTVGCADSRNLNSNWLIMIGF